MSTSPTSPSRSPWPPADIIIGNPPFLGAKRLKPEHGADYVNAIRKLYPEVPGMADYCVYWFRRACDHLKPCTKENPFSGRAGLVGTQNIRNNQSRVGGLDHIVKSGVIVEAVDNQPWSGEANVHVSIANWVKLSTHSPGPPGESPSAAVRASRPTRSSTSSTSGSSSPASPSSSSSSSPSELSNLKSQIPESSLLIPSPRKLWTKADATLPLVNPPDPARSTVITTGKRGRTRTDKSYELAFRECDEINSALSDEQAVDDARVLTCNTEPQRVFNGQFPRHQGFVLTPTEAEELTRGSRKANRAVVHPYLIGREMITHVRPLRWVIDFQKRSLLESKAFTEPFKRIEKEVLPHVQSYATRERAKSGHDKGQDQTWLKSWWQHFRCRKELVDTVSRLSRYLACAEVTKRPIFCFVDPDIRPDHTVEAFAFADDYSFSILQSDAHWQWFIAKCSKLKSDFRYTPESVFDTFPWPQSPTKKQIRAVAHAGREIRRIRAEVLPTIKGGLRALYRTLELPGKNPLKDAHAALDAATLDAYGFSARKDLLKQLLDLNLTVAARIDKSQSVTAPGVPPTYGDPTDLITDDCIQP